MATGLVIITVLCDIPTPLPDSKYNVSSLAGFHRLVVFMLLCDIPPLPDRGYSVTSLAGFHSTVVAMLLCDIILGEM